MNKEEFYAGLKLGKNLKLQGNYGIHINGMEGLNRGYLLLPAVSTPRYNLKHQITLQQAIDSPEYQSKIREYRQQWSKYKQTKSYIIACKTREIKSICQETTGNWDEHGSGRGDHYSTSVINLCWKPAELLKYFTTHDLAVVKQTRERVYAKSYHYGPSTRADYYLVGANENSLHFAHSIPACDTVAAAVAWIWDNNQIVARHGDIALAATTRNFGRAETVVNFRVHDSHIISGEIYKNGALYCKDAVLHHEKNQHPDVTTPMKNTWYKIIIARRSTKSQSSRD